ncbi:MAG: 50S ribosomal protein L10 [Phycisphaerales bacterium]|nr:MAG: 50S ribosomal protein L10 [Phycisphaerales bacterium]
MSKPLKQLMTENLRKRFEGVDGACVVDLTGLDVGSTTVFRRTLRDRSMAVEVVKNSLAARAFKGTPLQALGNSLEGPCALVTGGDSIIEVAKALVQAAREFTAITLKQAMLDGDPTLMTVEDVARLKSRVELLGEIAMLMASPGRAIAGCASLPARRIAGCLKAIVDRGGE